jgi:spore maturation protein CgeB
MRVLFSSYHNPSFWTITEYTERAIMKLGHELIPFDDREFIFPGRLRKSVPFLQNIDLKRLNRRLISLAFSTNPDLCLVAGGNRILPETIQKIKSQGIITVLWTIDAPRHFQPILNSAPDYDFIFCGGTEAQELLARARIKNTYWVPFACDPDIHQPTDVNPEEKKKWGSDVSFIGSYYPNRAQALEKLTDFDLKVWGPGWKKLAKGSPLKRLTRDVRLKPKEWIKIISSSPINIVIHFQDGETLSYQAAPRVYEALACRGFLLVDDQKDVQSLFQDGKHLVIFKNTADLRKKINYYLNQPAERNEIASQGYEETVNKHNYLHRMKEMFSVIEAGG